MMDLGIICKLKQAAIDSDGEDEMDDDEVTKSKEIAFDTINELDGRLKSLQVEIDELGCDYSSISSVEVSDAVDKLYAIHRRNENARKSAKRNNSRQTNILAFSEKSFVQPII